MSTVGLIITAAGNSTRFESDKSKQFYQIDGEVLLIKTLKAFFSTPYISEAIITMKKDNIEELEIHLNSMSIPFKLTVIEGGSTRKESVEIAFNALSKCNRVMIHDGARPYVSEDLISRLLEKSKDKNAVIPGLKETDTVKKIENGKVVETLDRDAVYRIQTPQVFSYNTLKDAYNNRYQEEITDESMLIEKLGTEVYVVAGDILNRKITTLNDLILS
ncbi:2-C-methyl-D-erythritol 4-phosphate cytidylyltransferase [Candidatus Marinamargulisbacteria bacterium SCGC AAA071-K20]|nr:2-C-methyl-D-erythritol 4-phosphate cytidylyltransferase [Candidatus Marinamargulisbacteria bacterium SCGC AAA071-K20]